MTLGVAGGNVESLSCLLPESAMPPPNISILQSLEITSPHSFERPMFFSYFCVRKILCIIDTDIDSKWRRHLGLADVRALLLLLL